MITARVTKEDANVQIQVKDLTELVNESFHLIQSLYRAIQKGASDNEAHFWITALLSMCADRLDEITDLKPVEEVIIVKERGSK